MNYDSDSFINENEESIIYSKQDTNSDDSNFDMNDSQNIFFTKLGKNHPNMQCIKEGYLLKQSSKSFQRAQKRYFRLYPRKLYYAKNDKSVIFDEIDLRNVSIAESSTKNLRNCFTVITPSRSIVIGMDNRKDMEAWISAIKSSASATKDIGDDPISHIDVSGQHNWYAASHARPTYCNVCREALSGVTFHGLSCEVCKYKCHKRCAVKAINDCKWTTLGSMRKYIIEDEDNNLVMPHQWLEGNLPVHSKCTVCEKNCGSVLRLQDWRCLWCRSLVHNNCRHSLPERCTLGPYKMSIVQPIYLHNLEPIESEHESAEYKGMSPLVVFVNSKSGDKQGVKIYRRFKQHLNPVQVFDLLNGGPTFGLKLFRKFEPFRILICGGDGSISWVLNEIDHLHLLTKCQVGLIPLGTGNDLSRVLGWGASFDDDVPLTTFIERFERASVKMLDRWSIMVYQGSVPQLPQPLLLSPRSSLTRTNFVSKVKDDTRSKSHSKTKLHGEDIMNLSEGNANPLHQETSHKSVSRDGELVSDNSAYRLEIMIKDHLSSLLFLLDHILAATTTVIPTTDIGGSFINQDASNPTQHTSSFIISHRSNGNTHHGSYSINNHQSSLYSNAQKLKSHVLDILNTSPATAPQPLLDERGIRATKFVGPVGTKSDIEEPAVGHATLQSISQPSPPDPVITSPMAGVVDENLVESMNRHHLEEIGKLETGLECVFGDLNDILIDLGEVETMEHLKSSASPSPLLHDSQQRQQQQQQQIWIPRTTGLLPSLEQPATVEDYLSIPTPHSTRKNSHDNDTASGSNNSSPNDFSPNDTLIAVSPNPSLTSPLRAGDNDEDRGDLGDNLLPSIVNTVDYDNFYECPGTPRLMYRGDVPVKGGNNPTPTDSISELRKRFFSEERTLSPFLGKVKTGDRDSTGLGEGEDVVWKTLEQQQQRQAEKGEASMSTAAEFDTTVPPTVQHRLSLVISPPSPKITSFPKGYPSRSIVVTDDEEIPTRDRPVSSLGFSTDPDPNITDDRELPSRRSSSIDRDLNNYGRKLDQAGVTIAPGRNDNYSAGAYDEAGDKKYYLDIPRYGNKNVGYRDSCLSRGTGSSYESLLDLSTSSVTGDGEEGIGEFYDRRDVQSRDRIRSRYSYRQDQLLQLPQFNFKKNRSLSASNYDGDASEMGDEEGENDVFDGSQIISPSLSRRPSSVSGVFGGGYDPNIQSCEDIRQSLLHRLDDLKLLARSLALISTTATCDTAALMPGTTLANGKKQPIVIPEVLIQDLSTVSPTRSAHALSNDLVGTSQSSLSIQAATEQPSPSNSLRPPSCPSTTDLSTGSNVLQSSTTSSSSSSSSSSTSTYSSSTSLSTNNTSHRHTQKGTQDRDATVKVKTDGTSLGSSGKAASKTSSNKDKKEQGPIAGDGPTISFGQSFASTTSLLFGSGTNSISRRLSRGSVFKLPTRISGRLSPKTLRSGLLFSPESFAHPKSSTSHSYNYANYDNNAADNVNAKKKSWNWEQYYSHGSKGGTPGHVPSTNLKHSRFGLKKSGPRANGGGDTTATNTDNGEESSSTGHDGTVTKDGLKGHKATACHRSYGHSGGPGPYGVVNDTPRINYSAVNESLCASVCGNLIGQVLLANADALCAPALPLMDMDVFPVHCLKEKCVMNNYFGIGLDAKISLDFHNKREIHPEKASRTRNIMWYGLLGTKELLQNTFKNLEQKVHLECDGIRIPLPSLQGIVILNISSYAGGTNFWGGKKEDDIFLSPSFDDKILEVVAVFGSHQLAVSKVLNIQHHRIAQCRSVKITITGEPTDPGVPIQVDGEAWMQPPGCIRIIHKDRAQMLVRDKAFETILKMWNAHAGTADNSTANPRKKSITSPLRELTQRHSIASPFIKRLSSILDDEYSTLETFKATASLLIECSKQACDLNRKYNRALYKKTTEAALEMEKVCPQGKLNSNLPNLRNYVSGWIHSVKDLSKAIADYLNTHVDVKEASPTLHSKLLATLDILNQDLKKLNKLGFCVKHSFNINLPHISSHVKFGHFQDNKVKKSPNLLTPEFVPRDKAVSYGAIDQTIDLTADAKQTPNDRLNEKPIKNWTFQDVCLWLDGLGLSEYQDSFQKHDIRGTEILTLERKDFKELGITKIGHVKRITQGIKDLEKQHHA